MNRKMHFSHDRSSGGRKLLGLLSLALATTLPKAATAEILVPLKMSVPSVQGAAFAGHMPAATQLTVSVALQPGNRAGLYAYADAVNDIQSPHYHRFLTPAQVGAKFGASAATLKAVTSYLTSKGLKITLSCPNGTLLVAKGKASAVESAFNTKINLYSAPSRPFGPKTFYSYATVPQLTKTLAPSVATVGGLQTAYVPIPWNTATPDQFRVLYNTVPLYNTRKRRGEGVTIGITNFDGYRIADARTFISSFNLPTPTAGPASNITKVSVGGGDGEQQAAEGEADLDIDCVLAMAPLANIRIYDAAGGGDFLSVLGQAITEDKVDLMTESYGRYFAGDASELEAESVLHATLATMGVTYAASTGDVGASKTIIVGGSTIGLAAYPAEDPNVLAVGGTWTNVNPDGSRGTELGWDGSGGGWETFSASYNHRPVYQRRSIVTLPNPGDYRLYPDVSLSAAGSNLRDARDPRGDNGVPFILSYYTVSNGVLGPNGGGTSAASPTMASGLALVLQDLKEQGAVDPSDTGKYRLGRVQDLLYETVGQDPNVFYDVQGGDNGLLPDGSEGLGGVGWDFVTGLGAVNFSGLTDSYVASSSIALTTVPVSAPSIFSTGAPTILLGKSPSGDATALSVTDGVSYTLQSVGQPGVGQVAAAVVDVPLQTQQPRRSATVQAAFSVPKQVTGYVYLYNFATKAYDLLQTVTGTGSMANVASTLAVDDSGNTPYIQNNDLKMLVRGLKPTRLGSAPFTLTVDQAVVVERVPRG